VEKNNMFNLDQAIVRWRRQMTACGVGSHATLDELECHLREDVAALVSAGMCEAQAFELAVSRMGNPGPVATEFKKITGAVNRPAMGGLVLWAIAAIMLAIGLANRLFTEKLDLLLAAHIFTFTAGYGAAFLTGGLAIYWVCCRWLRALSPVRQRGLGRAIMLFSQLSVGLVVAGFLLGMLWSRRHLDRYWEGDPRAIGCLCALLWLVAVWGIQRFGHVADRGTMLMCIGGNIIVSLAWFGPHMVKIRGYGMGSYWPLEVFLGVHVVFLALCIVTRAERVKC
jgi:hypothetical protein